MNNVEPQRYAGKRYTHVLGLQWTTKEDQLRLEPFKQHSEAVWTKRENFSQFATLKTLLDELPHQHSKPNSLRETFGKKIGMGPKTSETEEDWTAIAVDLANATTFVKPRHILITEKNHLPIFVDSLLSAYAAAAYLNGELQWRRQDVPQYHQ